MIALLGNEARQTSRLRIEFKSCSGQAFLVRGRGGEGRERGIGWSRWAGSASLLKTPCFLSPSPKAGRRAFSRIIKSRQY